MEITKEYVEKNLTDIHKTLALPEGYWQQERFKIAREFCRGAKTILSVGCGPREPLILNSTHAVDVNYSLLPLLRQRGWRGRFFIASCDALPFPDKSFDVAVCAEVIEHLPDDETIKKTFLELQRVARHWYVDVPNSAICLPKYQAKSHKQFFTIESLIKLIPFECEVYTHDIHIYAHG